MADPDTTLDPTAIAEGLLPEATRSLIRTADGLADPEYAVPSGLPGWSRAHVLAHLALNAEGLAGALTGIVEGRRVPMYASQEARDGDIEELAGKDPSAIRARLLGACTDLADAIAAVPDDAWSTSVDRIPGGRTFPARAVPGMRLREVEIHHVDLAAGYNRSDWPLPFATLLLDSMAKRGAWSEPFRVRPNDVDGLWTFGEDGGPTVTGSAADLGWWLTGRGSGEGLTSDSGTLPGIGAW
jgi:maleylpyruvate isomerase